MLAALAGHASTGEIAKQLDKTEASVRYWCQKMDLPIQTNSGRKTWSTEEELALRYHWGRTPLADLSRRLGRSENALRIKASKLGIAGEPIIEGKPWTDEEIAFLWSSCERLPQRVVALKLDRTVSAVQCKARDLGIFWRQGRRSVREVARELQVDPITIRRACSRLGLRVYQQKGSNWDHIEDESYAVLKNDGVLKRLTRLAQSRSD